MNLSKFLQCLRLIPKELYFEPRGSLGILGHPHVHLKYRLSIGNSDDDYPYDGITNDGDGESNVDRNIGGNECLGNVFLY